MLTIISPSGGNLSPSDFGKLMFSPLSPQPEAQAGYGYPDDVLLQAYDVVQGFAGLSTLTSMARRRFSK